MIKSRLSSRAKPRDLAEKVLQGWSGEIPPLAMLGRDDRYADIHFLNRYKRAFITGITGQDGSYLAELLREHGYQMHGLVRRVAIEDSEHRLYRIEPITDQLTLHPVALENYAGLFNVVERIQPHEGYHLAAQRFKQVWHYGDTSSWNGSVLCDARSPTNRAQPLEQPGGGGAAASLSGLQHRGIDTADGDAGL